MRTNVFCLFFLVSASVSAAGPDSIQGSIVDPSGAPVAGARVSVFTNVGVAQSVVTPDGAFELKTSAGEKLVVTAPGFAAKTVTASELRSPLRVQLDLAPVVDSVRVVGSAIDAAASQQGGSVTIIPREEIRQRNEPAAFDLLRYVPGLTFTQTGPLGGMTSLNIRGGYPTFNLVQIDGAPVNVFGGSFDFGYIPSEALDRVEVVRGPQSAIYGSYANSGVINFVTREPGSGPNLDVVAEGGSYRQRRFGLSGGGTLLGFGISASASQWNSDGPVANSDYRNQGVLLNVRRRFHRQSLAVRGLFNSNENGVPGPWGSDPKGMFTGIDTVSRNKNNFSSYSAHYQADVSESVRQELFGSFFKNNNGYLSPWGFTLNQDIRAQGEARTTVSATRNYVLAAGIAGGTEQVRNPFVTDVNYASFTIRRRDAAAFIENRFEFGGRLFLNAGARAEFLRTASMPPDGGTRPFFPAQTVKVVNPKVAAAYALPTTRLHASFGAGIKPPAAFDLAFTNNPALKPERTRSVDAGVEQRFFAGRLALDATYFYSRFYDLVAILRGFGSQFGSYESDNIANSRAHGVEFSGSFRPARWLFVQASYTHLKTEILSLDGASRVAPEPFEVGQELTRRPADSGSATVSFRRGRWSGNLTGYARGSALDVEPSLGARNGLYRCPGFAVMGVNLNYDLERGVTLYGNLRNALNRHYEEVFGYPAPRLNFVAGARWTLARRR